jgi:hypothetical protein
MLLTDDEEKQMNFYRSMGYENLKDFRKGIWMALLNWNDRVEDTHGYHGCSTREMPWNQKPQESLFRSITQNKTKTPMPDKISMKFIEILIWNRLIFNLYRSRRKDKF